MTTKTCQVPLHEDADGVIRVGRTRVTLDVLLAQFQSGATPEEIASEFTTLSLTDVYATISYYLQNRQEIDAYLSRRAEKAQVIRKQIESQPGYAGWRERLLERARIRGSL